MGLSLSTSQQFAFWSWVALAWGPGTGAQTKHVNMGNVGGLPKKTVGRSMYEALIYCRSLRKSYTRELLQQGLLMCGCVSPSVLILWTFLCHSCKTVRCMLSACISFQHCVRGPTQAHSYTLTITHILRRHGVTMPFMGLEGCVDGWADHRLNTTMILKHK